MKTNPKTVAALIEAEILVNKAAEILTQAANHETNRQIEDRLDILSDTLTEAFANYHPYQGDWAADEEWESK